jgi:hypothetical protein
LICWSYLLGYYEEKALEHLFSCLNIAVAMNGYICFSEGELPAEKGRGEASVDER